MIVGLVPVRQFEIAGEGLQLFLGTGEYVEGDVQSSHVAVLFCQPDVGLGLGAIAVLIFQTARQCCLIHLANR